MGKSVALGGVFEIGTAATIAPLPVLNPQTPFPLKPLSPTVSEEATGVASKQQSSSGGGSEAEDWRRPADQVRSGRDGPAQVRTGQHVSRRQCIWRLF
jgi:hypothetical protein